MRSIISYDDISQPASTSTQVLRPQQSRPPPSKKRKRSNQKTSNRQSQHQVQHWDDPGIVDEVMRDNSGGNGRLHNSDKADDEEDGVGSRELTYEEIWDDSALVDAWNAATEEYEAYHGPEKNWKKEPVNKSPLWYNVPPSPSQLKKSQKKIFSEIPSGSTTSLNPGNIQEDGDSRPLDFETFVPNHDASLAAPLPPYSPDQVPDFSGYMPEPLGATVSQDEAFTRAIGAMYWAGYYTAIYHSHRGENSKHLANGKSEGEDNHRDEEDEIEIEDGDEDEGLISTQR